MICKVPPAFVASQYPLTASILFASLFFVITVALSFFLTPALEALVFVIAAVGSVMD